MPRLYILFTFFIFAIPKTLLDVIKNYYLNKFSDSSSYEEL